MTNKEFLATLHALGSEKSDYKEIDCVFNYMDNLQLEGKFEQANALLALVDPAKYRIAVMLSFLTITLQAPQELLPARKPLYDRTKKYLTKIDPVRVDSLLQTQLKRETPNK